MADQLPNRLPIVHCPFHSTKWRSTSQYIINQIRRDEKLSSNHIKRLPLALCCCTNNNNKDKAPLNIPSLPELDTVMKWKKSIKDTKLASSVERFLKAANELKVADSDDGTIQKYRQALIKVVGVIYLVYHDQNEFLDIPKPVQAPPTDADQTLETTDTKTLTDIEFEIDIPVIPVTHIGTLIGANGCHLKALCSKYNIESIHLGEHPLKEKGSVVFKGRSRWRSMGGVHTWINETPVKVKISVDPNNMEDGLKFKAALKERGKAVCQQKQRHLENVKRYRVTRMARIYDQRQKELEANDIFQEKEGYRIGVQKQRHKNKEKDKQKPPPILDNSKCLHCQQPHSAKEEQCVYHPGYTVEVKKKGKVSQRWTCCNKYFRKANTLAAEHARTGCTHGNHNWRPVGNAKKSKQSVNLRDAVEDVTVAQKK